MDSTIEIEKNVQKPVDEGTWKSLLEKLNIDDGFTVDIKKRSSVMSIISNEFHGDPDNVKVFKTSKKGQKKGKLLVWRDKDKEDGNDEKETE